MLSGRRSRFAERRGYARSGGGYDNGPGYGGQPDAYGNPPGAYGNPPGGYGYPPGQYGGNPPGQYGANPSGGYGGGPPGLYSGGNPPGAYGGSGGSLGVYGDPSAGYSNQQAYVGNPQPGYGNPQAYGGSPQPGYGNSQQYGNQLGVYGSPQAAYSNPQLYPGNQGPPPVYSNIAASRSASLVTSSTSSTSFSASSTHSAASPALPTDREPTDKELDTAANALVDTFASESSSSSTPPAPYSKATGHLPKSFCLPCTGFEFDDPFERGYAYDLQRVSITQEQWLDFVDGLNLSHVGSPALRVVDTIGSVLGFMPSVSAMVAGAGLQFAAQSGMQVLSKTLTDRFLRSSNTRFFHPRGLSVRLVTTRALRVLIGQQEAQPEPSKTKKLVSGAGNAALEVVTALPFRKIHGIIASFTDAPTPTDLNKPPVYRRLDLLQGFILVPINFNVPPPSKAEGIMNQMNAVGLKLKSYKKQKKARKDQRRVERRQRLGGRSRRGNRNEGTDQLKALVAQKKDEGLLWVVLMPMEKDDLIEEIAVADDAEDVDKVNVGSEKFKHMSAREKEKQKDEDELDD